MSDFSLPHPTVVQWNKKTALQVLTTSESLGWNNLALSIERQEAIPEDIHVPFLEEDVIALLLEGAVRIRTRFLGGKSFDSYAGAQTLQLIPRHSEFIGRWDSPWTYVVMRLNRNFVGETASTIQRGDPTRIEFVPSLYFNDPLLYHLGNELKNEMQRANPLGPLYAEALTNRLTLYLLRHYSNRPVVHKLTTSRLTHVQLGLVDSYIHAHLEHKITLADLATCLHLSVPHFERMFRMTTHVPPYRYVLELRIERAQALLAKTRLPVAEVALQCGFSSQSHFTAHFTRYVGVAPARFARGVRE